VNSQAGDAVTATSVLRRPTASKHRAELPIEREWIGVDEAERFSGRSRWSWRRDAYAGRVGSTKVGARLLLRLSEVRNFMEANYRPAIGRAPSE